VSDFVLGLDLNDYRKGVPLRQAKRQGVRFVINKATEGTTLVHETNEIYRGESADLGLPFGNYMYWRFIFDAVEQAKFYLEHMGKIQFRPIIDVERINNRRTGGGPLVSVQANINHLRIVADTIEEECGIKPMLYSNWATWNELFGNTSAFDDLEKWVANYGRPSPWLPNNWDDWRLWQWTSSYYIDGYGRGVDGDWFNGNEGEFEAYIAALDKLWNPAPPEPPSAVLIVTGSILRANGNEELFVLSDGDELRLRVEKI
jgi:lysozyme